MKKFSLLVVLALAATITAWTSAGDVKITGTLLTKVQQFYGATGTNFVRVPDNLASALIIEDTLNGGDLAVITTTDGAEQITLNYPLAPSLSGAVAATGSTKTDCLALTKEYNVVTTATALQGVCLLAATVGLHQTIVNETAVTIVAYPLDASNDTLQVGQLAALTADVGYAIGPNGLLNCTAYTTTAWRCDYVPGARATVAATSSGQSGASLTSVNMGSFVAVTAADATKSITLPTGGSATTYIPGCIHVQSTVNTNTAYLPVYGNTADDDTINGAAADAVFTMGAGARVSFCSIDGVAWLTQ